MKIYVAHSSNIDFVEKLYNPIKQSNIYKENEVIFPHDKENKNTNSKDIIKACDLVISEVSEVSTGLGIELGWANALNKPILCIYEKGKTYSQSLEYITNDFIEYCDEEDMINKVENSITCYK